MRTHDDEICIYVRCHPQDGVERIACRDYRIALNAPEFGHHADLFGEDAFGFAPLHLDQVLRLIVIHHVDESEFAPVSRAKKPARRKAR